MLHTSKYPLIHPVNHYCCQKEGKTNTSITWFPKRLKPLIASKAAFASPTELRRKQNKNPEVSQFKPRLKLHTLDSFQCHDLFLIWISCLTFMSIKWWCSRFGVVLVVGCSFFSLKYYSAFLFVFKCQRPSGKRTSVLTLLSDTWHYVFRGLTNSAETEDLLQHNFSNQLSSTKL